MESVVLKRTDKKEVAAPLLKALAKCAHRLEDLGSRKPVLKRLKEVITHKHTQHTHLNYACTCVSRIRVDFVMCVCLYCVCACSCA